MAPTIWSTAWPFLKTNNGLYKDTNLSLPENTYTTFNDGAYNYSMSGATITGKTLSYKYVGGVKTYSKDLLDINNTSTTSVTLDNVFDLFLLSYISGKPEKYVSNPTLYTNNSLAFTEYVNVASLREILSDSLLCNQYTLGLTVSITNQVVLLI